MTVRAWFTISGVVIVALAIAFVVRFTSPVKAPQILASAGPVRLDGAYRGSCWPQPRGANRCERDPRPRLASGPRLPRTGTIRVVSDFPVQPASGTLVVRREGQTALEQAWDDKLPYTLDPGRYVLRADARYPRGGYVRYDFAFVVA